MKYQRGAPEMGFPRTALQEANPLTYYRDEDDRGEREGTRRRTSAQSEEGRARYAGASQHAGGSSRQGGSVRASASGTRSSGGSGNRTGSHKKKHKKRRRIRIQPRFFIL